MSSNHKDRMGQLESLGSARHRCSRFLGTLAIVAGALLLVAGPTSAVHDITVFELEGDAVDNPTVTGDDWSTVNGGGGTAGARTGVLTDPAPVSIFTQGGSKDYTDISEWHHKDGAVPDKDDITNAYAAAYLVNGELLIYFGADRFANDGDAQLGFWFFQQNVSLNPNGTFQGVHQVGDVLVLANFSNGGSQATIQVLEWVGTGGDQHGGTLKLLVTEDAAQCLPGHSVSTVCAITNPGPVASPWPYTPKSGAQGAFPTFSFFEGGINVTRIFQGTTPPCFASFMAETRSSTSVAAVLKDFVLGTFPVCRIEITKTCPSSTVNPTHTGFIYTFNGTVTNVGFGTLFNVTVVDDAGTPGIPADDITINLGTLGPSATANFNGTFESTQNPATNRASVSAATTEGGPVTVTDVSDPAICPPVTLSPNISVSKACTTQLAVVDNRVVVQVNFSGQVCNTGDVVLDNVTVKDDSGTPNDPSDDQTFTIGSLNPGECKAYAGNYIPRSHNNVTDPRFAMFSDTVKATGTARFGLGQKEDMRTATCPLCP